MFEYNPSPMWMYEIGTMKIVDVNEAALRQYGYSREEFLELTIRDLRPEGEVSQLLKHAAQSRYYIGDAGAWKHQNKSGEPFFVELQTQAFDYKGHPVKLVQARVVPELSSEEEIQQTLHKQLRYHLFNSPLAVLHWDGQLRLQRISEQVSFISGYKPEELLGQSIEELVSRFVVPADQSGLLKNIQNLADGDSKHASFAIRLKAKNGSTKHTRWHKSVLTDGQGRLISILTLVEDLTRQTELQESRERMLRIIEATSDFVALISATGKVKYINQSARIATGWGEPDTEALPDLSLAECLSKQTYRRLSGEILPALKENGIWEGQLQLHSKTGHSLPVSAVILQHINKDGQVEHYSATCRDISEHLKSGRQLQEQQQQLKLAMEGGDIGFWSLNTQKDHLEFDRKWLFHLLGYNEDDFSQYPADWLGLLHPDDQERVAHAIKALCKDQVAYFETEFRLKKNDGTWLWTMSRAKVVDRDRTGRPLRISGVHMDIDELKKTEQELKRALQEQRVLLGEIHHRVKNNLAVVSSLLQLQRLQTDSRALMRLLTDSEMRIQSIALVHEKLYETERLSEVDFGNYVRELAETIKQIHDPGDRVLLEISGSAVRLNINQAVPSALILNEVLLNAFEHGFGDDGEGTISIRIECSDGHVLVRVCDNGRGLPPDFHQKQKESLGLFILKTLADQLDANLVIENNSDKPGACVRYSFEQRVMKGSSSALIGRTGS